jgi:hypothetical protein
MPLSITERLLSVAPRFNGGALIVLLLAIPPRPTRELETGIAALTPTTAVASRTEALG